MYTDCNKIKLDKTMKNTYILIILLLFLSCNKNANSHEIAVISKQESIKQIEIKKSQIPKDKSPLKDGDSLNKNYSNELFNTKLVGLGVKDSAVVNPYKRYWIDFNAYCYSPTVSFYIDPQKYKIYAVEYDFENTSIKKDKILFQFNIEKIVIDEDSYQIFLNKVEQFISEDYSKIEDIQTIFNFTKLNTIYKLEIKNSLPLFYSEVNRYIFFISKKEEGKFEHEDCGDFDG